MSACPLERPAAWGCDKKGNRLDPVAPPSILLASREVGVSLPETKRRVSDDI